MKIRSMLVLYSATQYDKKALKLIIYLALTMLIAFADTFGIATLIPLVEGILRKDGSVQFLSYHFAVDTRLLIFFVLVWLLRGVVISIANYIVAHMIQNYKTALQISYVTNLFERDGREENKLTGEAFTRLTNDVQMITGQILIPSTTALTEALIVLALISINLFIYAEGILIIGCSLLTGALINHFVISKYARDIGDRRKKNEIQWADRLPGFIAGRVEARIYKVKSRLIKNIALFISRTNSDSAKFYALAPLSKNIIEFSAIIGLLITISYGMSNGQAASGLLFLAVSLVRMLPSAAKIAYAVNAFNFAETVLNTFLDDLTKKSENLEVLQPVTSLLRIPLKGFHSKNLLDTEFKEFDCKNPALVVLTGASGVGKSMWLSQAAQAPYDNLRVGYLGQENSFIDGSSYENADFFRDIDVKEVSEYAEPIGLKSLIDSKLSPEVMSGGQKRRLLLVRALIGKADLLFLDEPITGLDSEIARVARELILDRSKTAFIVMVSHNELDIAVADYVIRME